MVSIIDNVIGSKKFLDNFENYCKKRRSSYNLENMTDSLTENNYNCIGYDELSMDKNTSMCPDSNDDISSSKNQSLENDLMESTERELEHTLYEESNESDASKKDIDTSHTVCSMEYAGNISMQNNTTCAISAHTKTSEIQITCAPSDSEIYCNNYDSEPILYEQCCDLSNINEHDQTSTTLSQSCLPEIEDDLGLCSENSTDVPSNAKKYVKVYTHKRRNLVDNVSNKFVHMHNLIPSSTDCIDLSDAPSSNDIPITLLTSLDFESAEYILSLSTGSIQSILGGHIDDKHSIVGYKNIKIQEDADDNEQFNSPDNINSTKPILRRSMRLSQQDNDEAVNNSLPSRVSIGTERLFKRNNIPNRPESYVKARRKGKDDRKVPDQTIGGTIQNNKKSFNKKNNSKLIVKKNKSTCTISASKEKEEHRSKTSNKAKNENMGRLMTSVRRDRTECINRALWGDMSDTVDENEISLLTYTSNTEIPFAVGLLPLRTALERMQATPDYQPRKTRSSVAPFRHDVSNLKRKNYTSFYTDVSTKRQNCNNNESPNAVCHIEIRTAPSQYEKNRKQFLPDPITSLTATDVTNTQ